jgi:hypothetical protein
MGDIERALAGLVRDAVSSGEPRAIILALD